jgi:hypothetical protein
MSMGFYIKDFNDSQTLAFYIRDNEVWIWGNAAPKLLSALPIPHINPSYKPSIMPTSEHVAKIILSNDNVIILSASGDIGIIECQFDPWKPKTCKDFYVRKALDLDFIDGTNDIVCLVNHDRIVYKENRVQVKLPFNVKSLYTKGTIIILLAENNDVYKLSTSAIPQKIADGVDNIYSVNKRVFLSIHDHIYEIGNNLSLLELPDLAGAQYVSDRIAVFSGGRVATFDENCDIDNYIDIPEKVISVHGFQGSFFAVGESKRVWVWGYNVGNRLGLSDSYPTYVEHPTFHTNL